MYFYCYIYVFIDMYALFCTFFASWHYPATLTEVFRAFSCCKTKARVNLAKTGQVPNLHN